MKPCRGFTLPELVITLVIMAVTGAGVALYIVGPLQGRLDLERRTSLLDEADLALRRMVEDLRQGVSGTIQPCPGQPAGSCLTFTADDAGPQSFRCIGSSLTLHPGGPAAAGILLSNRLGHCRLTLEANGLIALELQLQEDGETVHLFHKVRGADSP